MVSERITLSRALPGKIKAIGDRPIESFNARLRDEVLNQELFGSVTEAKVLIERWRNEYNEEHPHSNLGYLSPNEYTATFIHQTAALA